MNLKIAVLTVALASAGVAFSSAQAATTTATMPVTITLVKACGVSATTLNFGSSVGLLSAAVNQNTTLSVTCTKSAADNIGLYAGQNGGGNLNARAMKSGASDTVGYQLYSDSGNTTVWGNTIGTNTVAGTGTGNSQSLTVYGNMPAQATPPAATYNDTITVTVTY